jgi:PAS domain-containing protein
MSGTLKKFLESTINDEASLKKASQYVDDLQNQLETATHRLELLEKAISTDYDSIVITEVDLEEPGPRIVYVNDGFTRMTGYSREEAIGTQRKITPWSILFWSHGELSQRWF